MTPTMVAAHASAPVNIDGILDEEVWSRAVSYELGLVQAASAIQPQETGTVRLACDDEHLYVAVRFRDSDIIAKGDRDGLEHNILGDLCEVFLKPANESGYWELFATPAGKKTDYFWASRSQVGLPSGIGHDCGMEVAATVDGSLNNGSDKDQEWSVELAIPFNGLAKQGVKRADESDWRILVARQNRSRRLSAGRELTMMPRLSRLDFHLSGEYAGLKLEKGE